MLTKLKPMQDESRAPLRGDAPCSDSQPLRRTPLIVFAGGGTGGHLYPALSIAAALVAIFPDVRVQFFATQRPIDRNIVGDTDHELIPQRLPRLRLAPWKYYEMCSVGLKARNYCKQRFDADPPDVVVGSGGAASFFPITEASRRGIPTVLHNPDALLGRANRLLTRWADVAFVQWDETRKHLPRRMDVRVTGCPVRSIFHTADRAQGIARFGLSPERKTLLVTGASQGAKTVNDAILQALPTLGRQPGWQILHLTGQQDYERVKKAHKEHGVRARVLAYTHDMADALAAADLVVTRGGASTLAEITAVGRASIIMPYPYHRDMHQRANALCLARGAGGTAACIVDDSKDAVDNAGRLMPIMTQLMNDDAHRDSMAAAARRMGRGDAATRIAQELHSMLRQPEVCARQ